MTEEKKPEKPPFDPTEINDEDVSKPPYGPEPKKP